MSNTVPKAESDAVSTYGVCGRHFPTGSKKPPQSSLASSYLSHTQNNNMRGRFIFPPYPGCALLTYLGPKVGTHDEVLALEKPPRKECQSDRAPVIDIQTPRHAPNQLTKQGQKRRLDRKRRRPHDAKERVDRPQRPDEQVQLVWRDHNGDIRGGRFVDEDNFVRVDHEARAGAEADEREEDEVVVCVEAAAGEEAGEEAGEGCDDGEAEYDVDGCMETKGGHMLAVSAVCGVFSLSFFLSGFFLGGGEGGGDNRTRGSG